MALTRGGAPPFLETTVLGATRYGVATLWRLRHAAAQADAVIAHGSSSLAACAVGLVGAQPFVYRSIGDPTFWLDSKPRRLRTTFLLRRSAAVVVMWSEAVDIMRDLVGPGTRVELIRKGLVTSGSPRSDDERARTRARLGLAPDRPVVAYLGALSDEKDPLLAIEATAHLPEVHLLIAGGGGLRHLVVEHAARRLPGRHTVVGPVADPRAVLAAADVLVLPSRTEGVPSAPLEAGLLGIPSVVADVGGAGSTVEDGVTGRVVRSRDPESLAEALSQVLAAHDSMGVAARAHVQDHFDIHDTAATWIKLCDDVGRAPRRRRGVTSHR